MVHFDNVAGISVAMSGIQSADLADLTMNSETKQAVSGISFSAADHRQSHSTFKDGRFPRIGDLFYRIVSVKLSHCPQNRDDQFPAGVNECFVAEAVFYAALLRGQRKSGSVDFPSFEVLSIAEPDGS